ncbi:MAG: sigma-70 family RNA polymerase sigma factor [Pirellulales bacterium]|nr:sigma-70 family RNA polymerase sigma factor [Pirellulales bacterium]
MNTTLDYQPTTIDDLAQHTDEELLMAYRESGETEAFETLVARYERELYSYLRRYAGSEAVAEDVFQQTFLQVHLKCDQFAEGRRFRPWLYTIATNQAIDYQRRNKRHRMVSLDRGRRTSSEDGGNLGETLVSGNVEPDVEFDSLEQQEAVRKAVAELPEQYQQVVLLIYFQGMKYREAAEILGIPVGTVKSRLHAAITKLSSEWPQN